MYKVKCNQQQQGLPDDITFARLPEDTVLQAINSQPVSCLLDQVSSAQILQLGTASFSWSTTTAPTFGYFCQLWMADYPWKPTAAANEFATATDYSPGMTDQHASFNINGEPFPLLVYDSNYCSSNLDSQQQLEQGTQHLLQSLLLCEPDPMQYNWNIFPLADQSPQEPDDAHHAPLSSSPKTKSRCCQYCQEVISEHLKNVKRHEQGCSKRDPQERSVFKCPCGKISSRQDSLKRHIKSKAHNRLIA